MTTPQGFGDYLLFRKLTTDALGDTYRAGKRGPEGIDRVVLLRQFNGAGVDRAALATILAERRSIHQVLQNPHIGEGVDAGQIGETPFASWEYISGKNLRELLKETVSRSFPLPIEHALFIAERVTFGLTAAYATRHHESRVHHGFLVPELVELSNEGEVRVLGFEAGQGPEQCRGRVLPRRHAVRDADRTASGLPSRRRLRDAHRPGHGRGGREPLAAFDPGPAQEQPRPA
jgi:hypothetical protein